MKGFLIFLFVTTFAISAKSQTYEFGGFIGGANYIGDVGKTTYLAPNNFAIGGVFKWNRSARHSFRGTLIFSGISGDDKDSNEERKKQRGYNFKNNITELSIGLEYTFWEFNLHNGKNQTTPYLYTGLTYFFYNALAKDNATSEIEKYDSAGSPAIPMVVGIKTTLGTKMILGFEIGARYTFTDNLDGSNPGQDLKNVSELKFGNLQSDDWYVFTGITLTFTFGRQPCYCNF